MKHLETGLWIAIVDGGRSLILVNDGTATEPHLTVKRRDEQDNPSTADQGRDRPPRAHTSGSHGSAMEGTDLHQQGEDRFVATFIDNLTRDASADAFKKLVLVAPPVAMGRLRPALKPPLSGKIMHEIAADWTKMSIPDITKALIKAFDK